MTTYRYINRDHTLVLRDDHVISWDPKTGQPVEPQPSAPKSATVEPVQTQIDAPSELRLWQDAGSPTPTDLPQQSQAARGDEMRTTTAPWDEDRQLPKMGYGPERELTGASHSISDALDILDKISDPATRAGGATSVNDLQQQVQLLTQALRSMVVETKQPTRTLLGPILGPEHIK